MACPARARDTGSDAGCITIQVLDRRTAHALRLSICTRMHQSGPAADGVVAANRGHDAGKGPGVAPAPDVLMRSRAADGEFEVPPFAPCGQHLQDRVSAVAARPGDGRQQTAMTSPPASIPYRETGLASM